MSEDLGSTQVNKVLLVVEAPLGELASSNSGLNYAIGRTEVLEARLDKVISKYKEFTAISSGRVRGNISGNQPRSGGGQMNLSDYAASQKGKIELSIVGENVHAFVVGQVKLAVNADQIQATLTGGGSAKIVDGGGPTGGGPGGGGPMGMGGGIAGAPGGAFTRTKVAYDQAGVQIAAEFTKTLDGFGIQTITEIQKGAGEVTKRIAQTNNAKGVVAEAKNKIALDQAGIAQQLASKVGADPIHNLLETAAAHDKLAASIREVVENKRADFEATGKQTQMNQLLAAAAQQQKLGAEKFARAGRMQDDANSAVEEERFAQAVQGHKDLQKYIEDSRKAHAQAEAADAHQTRKENGFNDGQQMRIAPGFYIKDAVTQQKEFNQYIDESTSKHAAFEKELDKINQTSRLIGKNMVQNVVHVTAWAAAVGTLYGSLRVAKVSLEDIIEVGSKQAVLAQVFRGNSNEVRKLTDDVLELAAVNGRQSGEAMQSAIEWSRMGLTRTQVNEAVRASLVEANLAEESAAATTEFLTSLTVTYNLHVSELMGTIGEMNAVANTYNISNREMMEGLKATAAAAKQAKIPLAELMGLIGAGVGGTKQSGTAVGNTIKSWAAQMSNPEIQNTLRQDHRVEVTTGGHNLKGMPEILREIFVAYQRMSDAERRSMIFSVGGRNQASRMAAILDNYVKSQTLAITAQLNQNSAEMENARIKDTLKNQLVGLTSEWTRFANTQGTIPMKGLSEITKAFQNLLRFLNLPGISHGVTAVSALMTAMAARLLITGVAMDTAGKKGGILINTLAALKNGARDIGTIMTQTAKSGPSAWWMPKGGKGEDTKKVSAIGEAAKSSAIKIDGMSRSTTLAKVALAGLVDVALPLLVIGAAVWGINAALDEMGATGKKATTDLERLDDLAQKSGAAAEAAKMQARLFRTAQEVLNGTGTTQSKVTVFSQVSEAAYPVEQGDSEAQIEAKELARKQLAEQGEQLIRNGDIAKANLILEEKHAEAVSRSTRKMADQFNALTQEEDRIKKRIKEIEDGKDLGNAFAGGITKASKKESIAELGAKLAEINDHRMNIVQEEIANSEESLQKWLETDISHNAFLERQKEIIQGISDIYKAMPKFGRIDELNIEIERLSMIEQYHKRSLDLLKAQQKERESKGDDTRTREDLEKDALKSRRDSYDLQQSLGPDLKAMRVPLNDDVMRDGVIDLDGVKKEMARRAAMMGEPGKGSMAGNINEKIAKIDALNKNAADLENKAASGGESLEKNAQLRGKIKEAQKAFDKAASERIGQDNSTSRELAETYQRNDISSRYGKSLYGSYATGDGAGQQMANQYSAAEDAATALGKKANDTGIPQQDRSDATIQALQLRSEMTETLIKAQEKLNELGKDELNTLIAKRREYERTLLTSGPGELLRKLAVNQMTRGGSSAGQFFAMNQEGRGDFLALPENSEEIRSIRRDRRALTSKFGNHTGVELGNMSVDQSKIRGDLYRSNPIKVQPNVDIDENIIRAAQSLTQVTEAITGSRGLLSAMTALSEKIHSMTGGGGGNVIASAPATPQFPSSYRYAS